MPRDQIKVFDRYHIKGIYIYLTTGLLDLDAGLLARSQNPVGPATGHLDPGFLVFLGPRRKCWDGSYFSSKLPLHASHVALPN